MLRAYLFVKGTIAVTAPDKARKNESVAFKNMRYLLTPFQR